MTKILNAIGGNRLESWRTNFKQADFYRQVRVQSKPSTLSVYRGFPLYASLVSHFVPNSKTDASIDTCSNEGEPSAPYEPFLQGVIAIVVGSPLVFYVFWRRQFRPDSYFLRWLLALVACFVTIAYGTYTLLG